MYGAQVAVVSSVVTLFSFCIPPSDDWRWRLGCLVLFLLFLGMLFVRNWCRANWMEHADLVINHTKVHVYIGDIFAQNGLKIIGVNNSIDLTADDVIVSKSTLHGQFIARHQQEIGEIKKAIKKSSTMIKEDSTGHKRQSYSYGSCVQYQDYVLTVLSKFDNQNKAYTSIQEYVQFWMTFWKNIDVIYNARTLHIPIMGAGQTRFRGENPGKQELLEIALWTMKESGFCNRYPDKSVNFVIHEGDAPDIDFYRIQKMFG